jgi:hypothetical protein
LLPDSGDDDKTEDLGGCKNDETEDAEGGDAEDAEEDIEDGEESDKGQDGDSIDWDNLGLYIISKPPDAN